MKTLKLPAIEAKQNGTSLLVSRIKARDLETFTMIEPFDSKKSPTDPDQGYQRPAEEPRIKKLANWLKSEKEFGSKVRMPSAILLSSRGANLVLSPDGTVTLRENEKLPVVDGQHRKCGFLYAMKKKGLEDIGDYEVPIVIMLDIDKIEEMRQFNVVNGTAKSVRTDLVNMILTQVSEHNGQEAIREGDHWRVVVTHVVDKLNKDTKGPWFDQIVMPDSHAYDKDERASNPLLRHRRVARATSFMTSLKSIEAYLAEHFSGEKTLVERAECLFTPIDSFWRAIRKLNPDVFKAADDYVIQKTPGIFALHTLCLRVMKEMYVGHRKWTEEQFVEVLQNCSELSDPGYWKAGDDDEDGGAASKYGSMKGFAELADLLHESMRS